MKRIKNLQSTLQEWSDVGRWQGSGITLVLVIMTIVVFSNVVRVIGKGIDNYDVYTYELESLNLEKERNLILKNDLLYYESDEAKEVLARDVLGAASPNSTLLQIVDDFNFYTVESKSLDVSTVDSNTDFWFIFVR